MLVSKNEVGIRRKVMEKAKSIDWSKMIIRTIVIIGVGVRILMAFLHFTHSDDNGAMNELMARKALGFDGKDIYWGFWTYAPLQLVFSTILENVNNGYFANLFLGRLPSLCSGIGAIYLCFIILNKEIEGNNKKNVGAIYAISLLALSWENIIYSAQGEPYEIVVLIGFIIVLLLLGDPCGNWWKSLTLLLVMSICCYIHFQVFMMTFAMYAALFVVNIHFPKKKHRLIVTGGCNLIATLPLLLKMREMDMFSKGVNWNRGIDGSFQFVMPDGGFVIFIKYIFDFFVRNTFLIYRYFFTIEEFGWLGAIIAGCIIVLTLMGMIYIHHNKMIIAVYTDVLLLLNLVLIIKGSLTYGPSRHMIFMVPTLLLLIFYGIFQIDDIIKKEEIVQKVFKVTSLVILAMFLLTFPNEFAQRRNYISKIQLLVEEYKPDFIYGYAWISDLYPMKIDGYANESAAWGSNAGWITKTDKSNITNRFMIISRTVNKDQFLEDERIGESFKEKLYQCGYTDYLKTYPNYKLIYQLEVDSGEEVEYASKYYNNYGNGLYLYIFEF